MLAYSPRHSAHVRDRRFSLQKYRTQMSIKHSNTTSDYLEWDTMLYLVHRLYRDENYRISLLIGCGCFFGLRISDLKTLRWEQLLDGNSFELLEKKTGKRRIVRINPGFQKHIKDCYKRLGSPEKDEPVFLSREHKVYSTQRINVIFKEVKKRYGIKINHFSTHSLRKTFGRKVVDSAGNDSEMALIKLSEIFNHSSPAITRRYLGLRQEEIGEVYDGLEF